MELQYDPTVPIVDGAAMCTCKENVRQATQSISQVIVLANASPAHSTDLWSVCTINMPRSVTFHSTSDEFLSVSFAYSTTIN